MFRGGPSLESLIRFVEVASRRYTHKPTEIPQNEPDSRDPVPSTQYSSSSVQVTLSEIDASWEKAARILANGEAVQGIVTGWNRGGLLVRWDKLQGFVPASQLREVPLVEDSAERDEELARWVGEELRLKVIELDRSRNRLVFSERATICGPKDGERVLAEIKAGEIREGQVSNLCEFGAFVDLGGVDGLIHISELSWGRVNHPRELLDVGQRVQVYVISVDKAGQRIALSLKRLHPDPWTIVDKKYHVGQVIDAVITNVVDFGAFARIEEGLEGLVHISEFPEAKLVPLNEIVQPGQRVRVRVLRIDSANHRLGLGIHVDTEENSVPSDSHESPLENNWNANTDLLY